MKEHAAVGAHRRQCCAVSARMNVDFPQPLGPIIAVTALAGMSRLTLSIARFDPYAGETFLALHCQRSGSPLYSNNTGAEMARFNYFELRHRCGDHLENLSRCGANTGDNSHQRINAENACDENKRSGHAWRCQSSCGEIAYVKICRGSAAISSLRSWFQKRLPNAVKK